MKYAILGFALCTALPVFSQITIDRNDMPNNGDTIAVSVRSSLAGFSPAATGSAMTWDYQFLIADSQRYEIFQSAASTPYPFFALIANYGNRNYKPDAFPFSLLGSPPENAFRFYKENNSTFQIVGEGLTVGGQPVPIFYDSPDFVHFFPLNYGNIDSNETKYSLTLPGFGYFGKRQKRVNRVDGWGTLKLPFGTFETIRVHSILYVSDTLYLDTLGFGFPVPMPTVHEYKWLAKGSSIPVLQINTAEALIIGGNETVTDVIFQDSSYMEFYASMLEENTCPFAENGSMEALGMRGKAPYTYAWSNGATTKSIDELGEGTYTVTVTDTYGQARTATGTVLKKSGDLTCINIPSAFTPNSDGINDTWRLRGIEEYPETRVEIYNRWGSLMFSSTGYRTPWDGRYREGRVPPGVYYYFITLDNGRQYQGSITVMR